MPPHDDDLDDQGGDAACWLEQVCERCGALIETEPHTCPSPARPD